MLLRLVSKYLISAAVVLWVYQALIFSPVNLGNDFNFVSYDHFSIYGQHPYLWDSTLNNGFGGYILFTLIFQPYSHLSSLWLAITANPFILHKLIFLWPILIIGYVSAHYASNYFLHKNFTKTIFIVLYLCNPYIVMLVSGGQIGVALAYAFLPTFFTLWYRYGANLYHQRKTTHLRLLLTALTFPLMLMFDARVLMLALLLILPIFIYITIHNQSSKVILLVNLIKIASISIILTALLHAHWILPAIFVEKVSLPAGYQSSTAADFFSFTRFDHAITWSHPNYPDNIFGKVNEFNAFALLIPILAFSAIKLQPTKLVRYLSMLAIIFAFLAKGSNEPFGEIYLWLFQHLPGMNLFRDATKFFIPLSLCYAYLISKSIENYVIPAHAGIYRRFVYCMLCIGIFSIWFPTFSNQIKGTLQFRTYPSEYQQLQTFLQSDPQFSRVLWVPSRETYGYTSLTHPAVSLESLTRQPECLKLFCLTLPAYPKDYQFTRQDLSNEIAMRVQLFQQPSTLPILQNLAIKYIILMPDTDHQIYTLDYKFDSSIYTEYKNILDQSPFLTSMQKFNNLLIYQIAQPHSLFTNARSQENINYVTQSPTSYQVDWPGGAGEIMMSQSYDQRWQIQNDQGEILASPSSTDEGLLNFSLDQPAHTYNVIFEGQDTADFGWGISLATQTTLGFLTTLLMIKNK